MTRVVALVRPRPLTHSFPLAIDAVFVSVAKGPRFVVRVFIGIIHEHLTTQNPGVCFLVGAPAFMRGKERFSAPEEMGFDHARFSAGHQNPGLKPISKSSPFPLD
jgi:hypothetical protein